MQKLEEWGYGDDIYKLSMISKNKQLEIVEQLEPMPGHRVKLLELFSKIENVIPKSNLISYSPHKREAHARQRDALASADSTCG